MQHLCCFLVFLLISNYSLAQKDANWNSPNDHFLVKNKWVETYDHALRKNVNGNHSIAEVRKYLIDNSTYIFQGKMKKRTIVESNDSTFLYADYLIEVEDVFKGKIRTKEITLKTRYFDKQNTGCAHCDDTRAFVHEDLTNSTSTGLETYNDYYIFFANKQKDGTFYLTLEKKENYSYIHLYGFPNLKTPSKFYFPSLGNSQPAGSKYVDKIIEKGGICDLYISLSKITNKSIRSNLLKCNQKYQSKVKGVGNILKKNSAISFGVVTSTIHINNGENIQINFTGTGSLDFSKVEQFEMTLLQRGALLRVAYKYGLDFYAASSETGKPVSTNKFNTLHFNKTSVT